MASFDYIDPATVLHCMKRVIRQGLVNLLIQEQDLILRNLGRFFADLSSNNLVNEMKRDILHAYFVIKQSEAHSTCCSSSTC